MPANTISWGGKTNNRTLPSVTSDKKMNAAEMNEIPTVVNQHAGLIDANEAAILALEAKFKLTDGTGTELKLHRIGGVRFGSPDTPKTDLVFTLDQATDVPVQEGFFLLYSSASQFPDLGKTIDFDWGAVDGFSPGNLNCIMGQWMDSKLNTYQIGKPISLLPPSSGITDITSFKLWWNSASINDDNNNGISNGQEILSILDNGPGGFNGQSVAGKGPIYNSAKTALIFDGVDDYLEEVSSTGVSGQPFTVATVVTPLTGINNAGGYWGADNASSGPFLVHRIDSGDFARIYGGTAFSSNISVTLDDKVLFITVFDGVNTAIYKNGNATAVFTGDVGSQGMNGNLVWGAVEDAASFGKIEAYDLMVFNAALNASELTTVRDYLVAKHGLPAS